MNPLTTVKSTIISGVVLALLIGLLTMGVLTLTTPLFTTLTDRQLLIDCVAGGTLVLAGIGCVVQGIRFLR